MGQTRSQPETTKKSVLSENNRLEVVATGMCGWRLYMEDGHICKTDLGNGVSLFAVFDGHGGPEVADFVSHNFVKYLTENENYLKKHYDVALTETFLKFDKILESPQGKGQLAVVRKTNQDAGNASTDGVSEAGCTAVVCIVTEDEVVVANAGDSRCFLGVTGKAQDMSKDHKPDLPQQIERIKKAGGEVMNGRVNGNLNLTRAIGDLEYKSNKKLPEDEQLIISKPDIKKRSLKGVQHIILGCDGLFQVRTNQDIYDFILKKEKLGLKKVAQDLLDDLLAPDGQGEHGLDNMSLIIVRMK